MSGAQSVSRYCRADASLCASSGNLKIFRTLGGFRHNRKLSKIFPRGCPRPGSGCRKFKAEQRSPRLGALIILFYSLMGGLPAAPGNKWAPGPLPRILGRSAAGFAVPLRSTGRDAQRFRLRIPFRLVLAHCLRGWFENLECRIRFVAGDEE